MRVSIALRFILPFFWLLTSCRHSVSSMEESDEVWPQFTMIYRTIISDSNTPDWIMLEYRNRRIFCEYIIDSYEHLRIVSLLSTLSCDQRSELASNIDSDAPFEVPNSWTRPARAPYWLGATNAPLGTGVATIIRDSSTWVPYEGGRMETRQEVLTYRRSDGIPLRWSLTVNGKEIERAEVIDLQIHSRPVSR